MLPNDYKIQNGCVNCKNVFEFVQYDSENTYHCTKIDSLRPLCNDIFKFDERFDTYLKENGFDEEKDFDSYIDKYSDLMDMWYKWSEDNKVEKNGICSNWEEKKNVIK